MLPNDKVIKVRNRSYGTVGYSIPEMRIQRKFAKNESKDLTMEESIILAGIPKAPSNYNPVSDYKSSIKRAKVIANLMYENEIIDKEQLNTLFINDVEIYGKKNEENLNTLMYYQDAVYKELDELEGIPDSFVDNVIYIEGKYLPVEIKLSVNAQANICAQVNKYCNDNYIVIDNKNNKTIYPKHIYSNNCLVIDTDFIYMYSSTDGSLTTIYNLDNLTTFEDLITIRTSIISFLIQYKK